MRDHAAVEMECTSCLEADQEPSTPLVDQEDPLSWPTVTTVPSLCAVTPLGWSGPVPEFGLTMTFPLMPSECKEPTARLSYLIFLPGLGFLSTIILGVLGSLVGGGIAYLLNLGASPYEPGGWVLATIGAIILLAMGWFGTRAPAAG